MVLCRPEVVGVRTCTSEARDVARDIKVVHEVQCER